MATYLQGLTDQIPVVQPFQPNFGLVQQALGTLQAKYDQGFASVKNAYNQVLNADISNPKLKVERDNYVKAAELSLKNLSSVDLSMQENQVAAERVFAPFWEDARVLTDVHLTKNMQQEIRKGLSARDSTDEKVREQYNDLSVLYIQNGLDQLKNTDPDSPEFAKIQGRRWVPFQNLEKYLSDQAKAENLEIKWNSTSGPYLVKGLNGERAIVPFKTWAHNMLGNNFTEQFRVMGTLEKEEGVKDLMRNNPGLTEGQATERLAASALKSMSKSYAARIEDLDDSIKKAQAKIDWYDDQEMTEEEAKESLQPLRLQQQALVDEKKNLEEEQHKFTKNYDGTLSTISKNPESYFASVNKQRVVDGWANARAANQSTQMVINPVLHEENDLYYKKEQLKMEQMNYALKERMFEASYVDTDDDGVPDTYKGALVGNNGRGAGGGRTGGKKSGKEQTALSGQKIGYGTTDVSKTGYAYDALEQQQTNRWNIANENFFDKRGVARVLTARMGMDAETARDFISELKRYTADPNHYKMNDKDGMVSKTLASLERESGIKTIDAVGIRNALVGIAGKYLGEKLKNGGERMEAEDREMVQRYMLGLSAIQQYDSTEKDIKEQTLKLFDTTHDFDIVKVMRNGQSAIMTSDDMAKNFQKSKYKVNGEEITREQLAQMYMRGEVGAWKNANMGPALILGKHVGKMVKLSLADDSMGLVDEVLGLNKKYESSKNVKNKLEELNKRIVPTISEYQSETGRLGFRVQYNLTDDDNDFGARLLSDAASADNRVGIYDDGVLSDNKDLNAAVLNILSQGESELEKYVSAVVLNTKGGTGNPTLDVIFKPVKKTDSTDIGDYSVGDLASKKISIELNPNASGETIRSIRFNSGFYVYSDLLRGKKLEADPILKAAGFDFSVLPDDNKNPSYVSVHIQRTVVDDATGKNKVLDAIDRDISFSKMTPDEIMETIYGLLDQHLGGNLTANERYKARPSEMVKKKGRDWRKELGGQ